MSFTQVTSTNLNNDITVKLAAGEAAAAAVANIVSMAVQTIQIADSSYNVLDDTAANTGGGYLVITGTGFTSDCIVIIGTVNATSTTYVNSTTIRAQVPAASAATYTVYVVDTVTGATAIKVNGLTYSAFPAWSTESSLSNQNANTSFGVNLSVVDNTNITYANTTALPAGTTLAANGYFSGTVSIGVLTTYSFDVKATDAEYQDSSRTFSLTVTVVLPNLYAWGSPVGGQLGLNDTTYRSSPTQVGQEIWSQISGTDDFNLALKSNGTLWGWGRNYYGQLGTNDTTYRSSPVQVGTDTDWTNISAGGQMSLLKKSNGTLWSCGRNIFGALGLNLTENLVGSQRSSPVQIGSDTTWSAFQTKIYMGMAIKTNGTLWTWGYGDSGQLGHNSPVNKSAPTQVGALTSWSKVSPGMFMQAAIKTDGTLWIWGASPFGQLGQNDAIARSSPVQVGALTNWLIASSGNYNNFAIKTNGTLWCWGRNNNGQLGLNIAATIHRSSPVQIGTDTNWSSVSSMNDTIMATKTNGTLWIWGKNNTGQLGLNSTGDRSSPVQVGTDTNWKQTDNSIAIGSLAISALKA